MKFSLTISPFRLTPKAKDAVISSSIEGDTMADAFMYVAKQLDGQPERQSLVVVVERTDV